MEEMFPLPSRDHERRLAHWPLEREQQVDARLLEAVLVAPRGLKRRGSCFPV